MVERDTQSKSEKYTFESEGVRAMFAQRTATSNAAFFLPYLKAGTRLLDAGCGGAARGGHGDDLRRRLDLL